MIENGFYKVTQSYIDLIFSTSGVYKDNKARPILCCMQDKYFKEIYWAIPTSDYEHRNPKQIEKIENTVRLEKMILDGHTIILGIQIKRQFSTLAPAFQ